jgi:hypothetical protein
MSSTEKTVEVEAADEGPKVKAKRHMSEAQLAALKKGREKLAEKRKQEAAAVTEGGATNTDPASVSAPAPAAEETPEEGNGGNDIEYQYSPLCAIM